MENDLIIKCQITAALSLIIGTSLFALYLFFKDWHQLVFAGLIFILLAIMVNGFFMATLVISIALYPKRWLLYVKTIGLLVLNIPIAFGYFYILLEI